MVPWLAGVFVALVLVCLGVPGWAQQVPDLSGHWQMDFSRSDDRLAFHGHQLTITQTPADVHILATWIDERGNTQVRPWDLRIGQWGPRRGGDFSGEPLVQARWDGQKLIMVKAPGTGFSALWILSLMSGGGELSIQSINTGRLGDWAFHEAAIPSAYLRLTHVFVKVE